MKQVFLSAGHSDQDPGAISIGGHREAALTLELRDEIAAILRGRLVRVVTDGRTGQNLPLRDACEIAKKNDGPAVELHFNAATFSAAGVEVLSAPYLKPLARELAKAISTVLKTPLRGALGWLPTNAGQHHRLAFCESGGLIVEVCFISNSAELNNYLDKRLLVAQSIAAVLEYAVKH